MDDLPATLLAIGALFLVGLAIDCLVVATGARTKMGEIAEEIHETERIETPLQRRMARFGRWVGGAIIGFSVVAFATGLARGEPVDQMFLTAVAIAVAAIPEGLPVVMTIALAVSVRRMARRNAIVRRLPAVETLGSCTVIVTDKTGTLTEKQMTVRALEVGGQRFQVTGSGLEPSGRRGGGDRAGIAAVSRPRSRGPLQRSGSPAAIQRRGGLRRAWRSDRSGPARPRSQGRPRPRSIARALPTD